MNINHAVFRIPYYHSDQMGIAHNSRYLVYCEIGRTEFFREVGYPYRKMEENGILMPVVGGQVSYRSAMKYDDLLEIYTFVAEFSHRSVKMGHLLYVDERFCAAGMTKLTCASANLKPMRFPPEVYQILEQQAGIEKTKEYQLWKKYIEKI